MSDALTTTTVLGAAGPGPLARVATRLRGWSLSNLVMGEDDTFTVRFQAVNLPDWVEVTIVPAGTPGPVFQALPHCIIRYRGNLTGADADRRAEVRALVLGVGGAIEARLAATPGATIAEVLGRRRDAGRVVFSRDMLREMLAPDIVEGVPVSDGWTLIDVYPTSYARETVGPMLELVLDFRRESDQRRTLLVVSKRDPEKPAFAQSQNFSLTYTTLGALDRDGAEALRALVAFTLQLRDHKGLEVIFPDVAADVGPALLLAAKPEDGPTENVAEWLNLAISSECSQSCTFCSIKEMAPPADGGDRLFARLSADLVSSRQRGVLGLRVNGYDPLSYSRILDVLHYAKDLGFARAHVFSPCTLLADRAFCVSVIEALPRDKTFFVPVYGVNAEAHDLVVGRPGAYALVMRALDNLVELAGAAAISVLSVATKDNLADLVALAAMAGSRGFSFSAHMPYPSNESRADRFFQSAPRQTDVVAALSPLWDGGAQRPFPVFGVAPCIPFRVMRERNIPVNRWLEAPEKKPLLPGAEYRDPQFAHGAGGRTKAAFVTSVVPCPHAATCTLASACPGEMLRSYVELYGMEEFQPVTLRALLDSK